MNAEHSKNRIRLVTVDAWFTLFQPREKIRELLICDAYRQIGLLPESVTNAQIWEKFLDYRRRFSMYKDDEKYWLIVNTIMFVDLCPDHQHESSRAKRVRRHIMTSKEFYMIQSSMIGWFKQLRKRGTRVVIASNTQREFLDILLGHFLLENAFDATYTSEELGVRKPHPEFWRKILQIEGIDDPSQVLHVGNSPNSDVPNSHLDDSGLATEDELQLPVALYDRTGRMSRLSSGNLEGIEIPEKNEETLRSYISSGLLSVAHTIPELRALFEKLRIA